MIKTLGTLIFKKKQSRTASTSVEVGGEVIDYTDWQPQTSYTKETIVKYNNSFHTCQKKRNFSSKQRNIY